MEIKWSVLLQTSDGAEPVEVNNVQHKKIDKTKSSYKEVLASNRFNTKHRVKLGLIIDKEA